MLAEALNFAATWPLTKPENRPFVRASVNLWSRARRVSGAWRDHEDNCHRAVLFKAKDLRLRRTAVVLGSGLLRDVPLDMLARAFDTVVLVDRVHLASVRMGLSLKKFPNIQLVERDLSGYGDLKAGRDPEPFAFLRHVPYLDFVVSANLISQIGIGAGRLLEKEPPGAMPADTVTRLVSAHFDGLAGLPAATCLLSDISFAVIDRNGHTHERQDLLAGVAHPEAFASWDWPVAPLGEESPDYRVVHRVIAA
ncbi:hypothetical protein NOF55_16305 [Rhizobiaceae bacterium BDR2-2]|uniref:Uncharacterized protein n=1 Tax=Ectorhizobium quercum TaxID=2965071 RepID=A0AAE3SW01_9HYPH|nr:hypothetical protein [Ectorhizobium quercum]MCX8996284.1 hypothetical protein [Ectorhizobium quercum]MCX8998677.1 hypothetical protein [Ectorhizobium quercum]